MPLLDVPPEPRQMMLEFAESHVRHALRATCTAMYGLPVVGHVWVSLQSSAAIGLCQKRGAATDRLSFWGSAATRLTLKASSSRLALLAPLRDLCRALQRVLGDCPATVELALHDCAHEEAQGALEWLASEPFWSGAELRLACTTDFEATDVPCLTIGAGCSDALKERLVWCDGVFVVGRRNEAVTRLSPFVALQNLRVTNKVQCVTHSASTAECARLFPAVQHVLVCAEGGGVIATPDMAGQLAPLAQQIRSLTWIGRADVQTSRSVLHLPEAVALVYKRTRGSVGLISGGRLVDAEVATPDDLHPRNLCATGSLTIRLTSAVTEFVIAKATAIPELQCPEGVLLAHAPVLSDHDHAAALVLIGRMRSLRTLTIAALLLTPALVKALPSTLRDVVVIGHTGASFCGVRLLMNMPDLHAITLPHVLDGTRATTNIGVEVHRAVRELQGRDRLRTVPAVHLPGCWCYWDVHALGLPPRGLVAHRVRLSRESMGRVPLRPTRWTRGVLTLDLPFPLGPAFWERAAGLAEVFPDVNSISTCRPREGIWTRDFEAMRDLCAALGPRLRRVDGLEYRDLHRLQNERVTAACPWLCMV